LTFLVLKRVKRTVMSKKMSGYMIDLKSSKNLISNISLLVVEEGFGLEEGRPSVTLA
jgi:hypothetical protein